MCPNTRQSAAVPVPALQSNWLTYHVITCFIGYAAFALACGVSIMYLIKVGKEDRSAEESPIGGLLGMFPSTKVLDDLNYKAIMVGFPMLTLGIITGAEFKIQQTQLEPGDILIGYTDGVTEALSPQETLYSKEKFCAQLEIQATSAAELIERIRTDLFAHIDNAPQFDDITMIAVHRKPEK